MDAEQKRSRLSDIQLRLAKVQSQIEHPLTPEVLDELESEAGHLEFERERIEEEPGDDPTVA